MAMPDRIPVLDAFDVVPHPVAIDHACTCRLRDPEHLAVNVFGYARNHEAGWSAEPLWPVAANEIMIAADPSRRHDHGPSVDRELSDDNARAGPAALHRTRLQYFAAHPGHPTVRHR